MKKLKELSLEECERICEGCVKPGQYFKDCNNCQLFNDTNCYLYALKIYLRYLDQFGEKEVKLDER